MMLLFHTHSKVCVIRMLITTKTLFYWTNAGENASPPRFPKRKSLEFPHAVTISRLSKRTETSSSKQNKSWRSSFLTLFTAKDVDFMHFKVFRTENILKWISKWTAMGKPVLISKLQDWCYGITVYRCRALLSTHQLHAEVIFIHKYTSQTSRSSIHEPTNPFH